MQNIDIDPPAEPWGLFTAWYALAQQHEPNDANAMALATADNTGRLAVRMVLMKDFGPAGVTFFTNRNSRKAHDLAAHDQVGLCFHWKSLRRQIRLEGRVRLASEAESDAYFATRSRGSQIGAWASKQSEPLSSRAVLEAEVKRIEATCEGKPVPRPPHWGGYVLEPDAIEFWQDREFRLHDRILYRLVAGDEGGQGPVPSRWAIERLYP